MGGPPSPGKGGLSLPGPGMGNLHTHMHTHTYNIKSYIFFMSPELSLTLPASLGFELRTLAIPLESYCQPFVFILFFR
jgi:hypothetical protein